MKVKVKDGQTLADIAIQEYGSLEAAMELGRCSYKAAGASEYTEIKGNNYTAAGGSFTAEGLENTLGYVVQG